MKKINLINILFFITSFAILTSCKKLVEVSSPVTSVNSGVVYDSDANASAVLTGIYMNMSKAGISLGSGITSTTLSAGLSSDEIFLIQLANESYFQYASNSLTPISTNSWSNIYNIIFVANSAIEGLQGSIKLTPAIKAQLLGEAKFIRAFCYFYLVNLYGGIPLAVSTDYKVNSQLSRSSSNDVYERIIGDLKEAQILLNENYVGGDGTASLDRVRPNRGTATAMLARSYLYIKDYANAVLESSKLIENNPLYELVDLNNVFLKNSKEAIWQIPSVSNGFYANTPEGREFILDPNYSVIWTVSLQKSLVDSFEPNDKRKIEWVNSVTDLTNTTFYYPFKYKIGNEDKPAMESSMILRLGEQFLICAEANAELGNISEAERYLNIIRARAGLPSISTSNQSVLSEAIFEERRNELFIEWGHRWLDLKRKQKADAVLGQFKGDSWTTTDQFYPIPQYDVDRTPNLTQTPGY